MDAHAEGEAAAYPTVTKVVGVSAVSAGFLTFGKGFLELGTAEWGECARLTFGVACGKHAPYLGTSLRHRRVC